LVANYTNLTLQINKNILEIYGNSTSNILLATSNYTGYFEDVSDILVFPLYYSQMFHLASNGFIIQIWYVGSSDVSQS
jgi:hypothetical protein